MQKDIVERLKDFPTLVKLVAIGDAVSAQAIECFSRDAMLEIQHLRAALVSQGEELAQEVQMRQDRELPLQPSI